MSRKNASLGQEAHPICHSHSMIDTVVKSTAAVQCLLMESPYIKAKCGLCVQ